ncbi:hypothetical protein D3C77_28440 [compost metagenome]
MLLVKRICQFLRRPVFEVMGWPASELEYWSLFFSIDDNKDKPIIVTKTPTTISLVESKSCFRELMN